MKTLFVLLKKEQSNNRLLWHRATWQPPVPAAQQAHRRRDQQRANDGRICQHGNGHPHADLFRIDHAGEGEGHCHDHEEQCGVSNDATRLFQATRHCLPVVVCPQPLFADAAEQEHFVVHRQAEEDAEEHDGNQAIDEPTAGEAEDVREVAPLEDED